MDPTQRQIYDAYGEKGVESGLNVGSLLKTPAEVRAEFLKQHYASQLQVQPPPCFAIMNRNSVATARAPSPGLFTLSLHNPAGARRQHQRAR